MTWPGSTQGTAVPRLMPVWNLTPTELPLTLVRPCNFYGFFSSKILWLQHSVHSRNTCQYAWLSSDEPPRHLISWAILFFSLLEKSVMGWNFKGGFSEKDWWPLFQIQFSDVCKSKVQSSIARRVSILLTLLVTVRSKSIKEIQIWFSWPTRSMPMPPWCVFCSLTL